MTARNHFLFWSGTFALFLLTIWLFKGVLLPFVLGVAVAYLLDPIVEKLEKHKIRRWVSTLVLVLLFYSFVFLFLLALVPLLYKESTLLIREIPGFVDKALVWVSPYLDWAQSHFGETNGDSVRSAVQAHLGSALKVSRTLVEGIAAGGQAFMGVLMLIILTPIVSFFMMNEWPALKDWIMDLLPRKHKDTIIDLWKKIDTKLSGFVRGQLTVAFMLGLGYAIALTIAGLKFGFLIGIVSGILSIIPMVGSIVGLLISVGVAWFQSGEWSFVAIIAAIFLIGQFIEGNFLTPKLIGDSVGLHPLWILFALMAGGALFGIVGMLLAVPVAAVISVLGGFAIRTYKASPYYQEKIPKKPKARKPRKKAT